MGAEHKLLMFCVYNQPLLVQALHRLCSLWRRQLDGEEANKLFKPTQTTLLFLNLVCDSVDFLQSFRVASEGLQSSWP
ncbi:hypothetical protein GBAR_LOCUS2284 [Geodia barretti]|uniref:Uncharacterized protein n=1 Tax=Geodia barretti TaxID=519541 RepID=A0AA35R0U5_GEOBA|nr:hypothetical protein GBAR_LOCUS2284 [Geodia barretti]